MSFIIDVPSDSGVFVSGVDGDDATAVEPSLFGKCIFACSRFLTFDAIMIDFFLTFLDLVELMSATDLFLSQNLTPFTINFHQDFNPLRDGKFISFYLCFNDTEQSGKP